MADKLSGLISKEGAAQIVAAELGINLDKQKVKEMFIELEDNMAECTQEGLSNWIENKKKELGVDWNGNKNNYNKRKDKNGNQRTAR